MVRNPRLGQYLRASDCGSGLVTRTRSQATNGSASARVNPVPQGEGESGLVIAHGALAPVHLAVEVGEHANLVAQQRHCGRSSLRRGNRPSSRKALRRRANPRRLVPVLFARRMCSSCAKVQCCVSSSGCQSRHAIPGADHVRTDPPVGHRMFSDGLEAIGIERKSFHPTLNCSLVGCP